MVNTLTSTNGVLTLNYSETPIYYPINSISILVFNGDLEPPFTYESYFLSDSGQRTTYREIWLYISSIPTGTQVLFYINLGVRSGTIPFTKFVQSEYLSWTLGSIGSIRGYSLALNDVLFVSGVKGMSIGLASESSTFVVVPTLANTNFTRYISINLSKPTIQISGTVDLSFSNKGLTVVTFLPDGSKYTSITSFDTESDTKATDNFVEYIESLLPGTLVFISARSESRKYISQEAYDLIQYSLGSICINAFQSSAITPKWFILSRIGQSAPCCENTASYISSMYYLPRNDGIYGQCASIPISMGSCNEHDNINNYISIQNSRNLVSSSNLWDLIILSELTGLIKYQGTFLPAKATDASAIINDATVGDIVIVRVTLNTTNYPEFNLSLRTIGSVFVKDYGNMVIIGRKGSAPGTAVELHLDPGAVSLCFHYQNVTVKPFIEAKLSSLYVVPSNNTPAVINGITCSYFNSGANGLNVSSINKKTGSITKREFFDFNINATNQIFQTSINSLKRDNHFLIHLHGPCTTIDAQSISLLAGIGCKRFDPNRSYCAVASTDMNLAYESISSSSEIESKLSARIPVNQNLSFDNKRYYISVFAAKNSTVSPKTSITFNGNDAATKYGDGLNVLTISNMIQFERFDTTTVGWESFLVSLNSKPSECIVAVACQGSLGGFNKYATSYPALALFKIGGFKYFYAVDSIVSGGSYVIIGKIGSPPGSALENYSTDSCAVGSYEILNTLPSPISMCQIPYITKMVENSNFYFNGIQRGLYYTVEPAYSCSGDNYSGNNDTSWFLLIGNSYSEFNPNLFNIDPSNFESKLLEHAHALITGGYTDYRHTIIVYDYYVDSSSYDITSRLLVPGATKTTIKSRIQETSKYISNGNLYVCLAGLGYSDQFGFDEPSKSGILAVSSDQNGLELMTGFDFQSNFESLDLTKTNITVLLQCAYSQSMVTSNRNNNIPTVDFKKYSNAIISSSDYKSETNDSLIANVSQIIQKSNYPTYSGINSLLFSNENGSSVIFLSNNIPFNSRLLSKRSIY